MYMYIHINTYTLSDIHVHIMVSMYFSLRFNEVVNYNYVLNYRTLDDLKHNFYCTYTTNITFISQSFILYISDISKCPTTNIPPPAPCLYKTICSRQCEGVYVIHQCTRASVHH